MPKVKTNRAAAKRFKIRGSGKIKRKRAFLRHNLGKRDADTKRVLRKKTQVSKADEAMVMRMLPNG